MLFRLFENAVPPYTDDMPRQPPGKLLPFIWHYTAPFKWLFLGTMLTVTGVALIEIFAFSMVGNVVDWMSGTTPETFWQEFGLKILLICLMIAVVWPLLGLLDDLLLLQGILGNMAMRIRWQGHRYLLRQSTSFFANDFAGRISTKLMQTAQGARDVVIKITNLFVYMVVYFTTTVIMFGTADWLLAIPIILWLALYVGTMFVFLPRLQNWSMKQADARSALTGRIVDAYTNIQTVKMFASRKAEEDYSREGMDGMLATVYPQNRLITTMSFTLALINGSFIASTIALGAYLWSESLITLGALAFAGTLALRIQGMSHYFLWEAAFLFENIGSTQDGMGTLSKPLAITDKPKADTLNVTGGEVRFDQVTFQYGSDKRVIRDLSLTIEPGEKVGVVGRSGAGKSTLVNLMLRLYDVEKGRVLIDEQDVRDVSQESLRRAIAVVTQDTSLLHRSIRDNISYGRPDATEDEIIAAAKQAEAYEFILSLEDQKGRQGLDAHVGERGVKLSGGQRQRIAIARVILKNAPILILDEATSALDSEVEAAIQSQMDKLMSGKTVLAIAHRLSTIAAMDRLIVLDAGQIAEEGTHDDLIARGGLYAQLWARQSGGFIAAEQTAAE